LLFWIPICWKVLTKHFELWKTSQLFPEVLGPLNAVNAPCGTCGDHQGYRTHVTGPPLGWATWISHTELLTAHRWPVSAWVLITWLPFAS
jgi:hypothetical protein